MLINAGIVNIVADKISHLGRHVAKTIRTATIMLKAPPSSGSGIVAKARDRARAKLGGLNSLFTEASQPGRENATAGFTFIVMDCSWQSSEKPPGRCHYSMADSFTPRERAWRFHQNLPRQQSLQETTIDGV